MTNDNPQTGPNCTTNFLRDRRGVSELLGALLVFALLLVLLVLAQVTLVPALNQQVEYEHNQRVGNDVGDLQTGVSRVAATGAPETVNVELGVTYPNRPLLINPPPVQGTVRTTDPGTVTISGITSDNPETADFWTGTETREYDTRSIVYSAPYNEYRNPGEVHYENSVTYRSFDSVDRNVVTGTQVPVVSGNRISIVTIDGSLEESSQAAETVAFTPISAPSQRVAVRSVDSTTPITITATTGLDEDDWADLVGDEPNVRSVAVDDGTLTLTLEPGNYQLRLAHVGVGRGFDPAEPAYLTRESGTASVVPTAGGEVGVQVRDRYNNPVAGVDVTFELDGNGELAGLGGTDGTTATATTDEDGRATVGLSGPDGTVEVTASSDLDGSGSIGDQEEVVFGVQIGAGDGTTGDAGELNPNRDGRLVLNGSTTRGGSGLAACDDTCVVRASFDNRVGEDVRIDSIRVNAYQSNAPGASAEDFPDYAVVVDEALNVSTPAQPIEVLGPDVGVSAYGIGFDAGSTDQIRLRFYRDGSLKNNGQRGGDPDGVLDPTEDTPMLIPGGEGIVVTLVYSYEAGGERVEVRSTYLLSPVGATKSTNHLEPVRQFGSG